MPQVKTADPAATPDALDAAFASAMGAPVRPREVAPPPEIDPDAPHGRGEDGAPLAPFGYTKEGKPRRTTAGRKPKEDQARTAPASSTPDGKPDPGDGSRPKLAEKDYTETLAATSESLWVGLSMASMMPLDRIPVISALPIPAKGGSRKLGAILAGASDKIAAQAHLFNANRGALVGALNIAANNNQRARRLAEKLETGDATWALMCATMIVPFVTQSASLWTGTLEADSLPSVTELAKANRATLDSWVEKFNTQLQAAAEEATVQLQAAEAEAA